MTSIYQQKNYNQIFGTYPLAGDELIDALNHAMDAGCRAIDTAQMYNNESGAGAFLKQTSIPRDELCITTKVHPDNYTEEKFIPSVHESLKKLGLDSVDCLLLHWPKGTMNDIAETLNRLQQAHDLGLAKNIGVSNFTLAMLALAQDVLSVPVACNQVEFHPLLDQSTLLKGAKKMDIMLTAYSPLVQGKVLQNQTIQALAKDLNKTPAQITLRWILQKGVGYQVMSTKPVNIKNNFDLEGFTLSDEHMARIDRVNQTNYRTTDGRTAPWGSLPHWD